MNVSMQHRNPSMVPFPLAKPDQMHALPNGTAKSRPVDSQSRKRAVAVLSHRERQELATCEGVIERGWHTFLEVGQALARIRDQKLYRTEYGTFEVYCRQKWQYQKSHVYRLIGAAEVVTSLSPIGDIYAPNREAQIRPLIGLAAQEARTAWKKACEKAPNGKVTAKLVREVLREIGGTTATAALPKIASKSHAKKEMPRSDPTMVEDILRLIAQAQQAVEGGSSPRIILRLLELIRARLRGQTAGRL